MKLQKSCDKYDLRKFGFLNSVVIMQNSFRNWVVSADITDTFEAS